MRDLRDQPLSDVVALALLDVKADQGDGPVEHLVELHNRANEETLATALRLTLSTDRDERTLGVLILRELGPFDSDGRRPYSTVAIPRLRDMLHEAPSAAEECNLISALSFNAAREGLPEFLARSGHPDLEIRRAVAFHLPSVVDHSQIEPEALSALEALAHDEDGDVRFYALFALLAEDLGVPAAVTDRALECCTVDDDPQIRQLAIDHATDVD